MATADNIITTLEELRAIRWFHSFDLGNGDILNGIKALDALRAEAEVIFDGSVAGKSVLDIGAWDGFFSFEAERRGATRVIATDHFCWSGSGWGTRDGFDALHRRFGSKVEPVDVDVNNLPDRIPETFDLVLFLGVFYHLKDPYVGLETAARMSHDAIVVETLTAFPNEKKPAMRLLSPGEISGDPTNFYAPNVPALKLMLETFGFSRVEALPSPVSQNHPLLIGKFRKASGDSFHRTIVRAWR